jgi:hypothetical protein
MLQIKLDDSNTVAVDYHITASRAYGLEIYIHELRAGERLLASTTLLSDRHPTWALNAIRALQRQIDANMVISQRQ